MVAMSITIGVDVGGTKIAAGAVTDEGELLAHFRKPTPAQSPDAVVGVIAECVNELALSYSIDAIGIGAAGFVDAARTSVIFAPNLAWRNEPLARRVEEATGHHVVVENDANAAAWAEFRFGAASGTSSAPSPPPHNAASVSFLNNGLAVTAAKTTTLPSSKYSKALGRT